MSEGVLTGLFGKLPASGDFVTRGFPSELRRRVDLWLSARAADLADPAAALLPSGAGAILVACVPSTDRLGRAFPLAVACQTPWVPEPSEADAWCVAAIALLRAAVSEGADVDELAAATLDLPCPAGSRDPLAAPLQWTPGTPFSSG